MVTPFHHSSMPNSLNRALILLVAAAVACDRGASGTADGDVAPAIIAPLAQPYQEASVSASGTVAGIVTHLGPPPVEQQVSVTKDDGVCRTEVRSPLVVDSRVPDAVVWLEGVTSGKTQPIARRYELTQEHCVLSPRVQAVSTGGTLNVLSRDPVVHRTRFTSHPGGALIALVSQVDAGQLVPEERVAAKAGLVEIRCDEHPWTHGWLAVFDHPYYAVTSGDGSFTLDDVPPGTYTLVVWHERGGRTTRSVTVADGESTAGDVRIRVQ